MAEKSHFFHILKSYKVKISLQKVMLKNICHSVGLGERMVFVLRERAKVQFRESGIKCWWRHDIIDSCLKVFQSIRLLPRFIIMGAIIDTLEKKAEVKVPSSLLSLWMAWELKKKKKQCTQCAHGVWLVKRRLSDFKSMRIDPKKQSRAWQSWHVL